jgi:hypothetical protein
MYMSSIEPPFPVGITLNTSRHRQSRNQDVRSLRISATCKERCHFPHKDKDCDARQKSKPGKEVPLRALDSRDRRLVLLLHYNYGRQQRCQ